jgi:hypothetical protein
MPSDASDSRSNNSTDGRENVQNKASIIQIIDELISHMNRTKSVFKLMIISSFILSPVSLMLTAVFMVRPSFMHRILFRLSAVGIFLMFFIVVSVILASIWLYMGLSEQRFFFKWNNKFIRYKSLKNQLDKERRE